MFSNDKEQLIGEIKAKLADYWVRGREQRIYIGGLLLELEGYVEHGQWGPTLAELKIPPSTARDYMAEARAEFGPVSVPAQDQEEEVLQQLVTEHEAEVAATQAKEPIVLEDVTQVLGPVLHCTADQRNAYKAAKREDKHRVYFIFHKALLEVIGEVEPTPLVADEEVFDAPLAA